MKEYLKALLILCLLTTSKTESPIKHIVVLMMENRSFDNLLGFLHSDDPNIDGLTGTETNPYNTTNPKSKIQKVTTSGFDTGPDDPGHGWEDTTEQIFGFHLSPRAKGVPKMNGFVQNALGYKHTAYNPMSMFTKKSAPIINTLAQEFAVFDKWFCSLPGPTDPNRAYFMSGTSDGVITNFNGTLWGQQSFFDFLRLRNVTWRAYYQDDPWAIMYFKDMHQSQNHQHVFELDSFFSDVGKGDLPQFSLLQPRMTSLHGPPTWQHPDASVGEGERLYKKIYETLRNSSLWENSAFILTYDEHGGFFDHVAPPQTGVPNPDKVVAHNGFNFDRLGIRIPTLVISPWIPKNTVVHEAKGPTSTSQYDATSIMATVNKIFGISDHLSAREAWAGTFEDVFSLTAPRTDCPTVLPDVPAYTKEDLERQWSLPLNEHLQIQVDFYCKFNRRDADCGKNIKNQFEASVFIDHEVKVFMNNLRNK